MNKLYRAYIPGMIIAVILSSCQTHQDQVVHPADGCTTGSVNIVLFVSDDHGQDTGAYGNEVIQTPNLDALASEGVLFRNAFATTASCSASRSVILTGLHNHRNGQFGHEHDYSKFSSHDNIQSVSALLSDNGYRTGRSGKYHVAPGEVYRFDETLPGSSRNPYEMANRAKEFITPADKPFFLLMGASDPHRGGGPDTGLPHEPDRFGNAAQGYEGIDPVFYGPDEVIVPSWLPDNEATRQELAQYYQSVSRLDQGFGRLVHNLKETGAYDNTVLIYMSDHGMAFPGAKTNVYEPALLSPLIVRDPCAETAGTVNEAMVSWVDITPTILDYAGVETPAYSRHVGQGVIRDFYPGSHGLHGRSFRSVLEEEEPVGWDEIQASHTFHEIHMYYPMRVVRDRDYKLIWNLAHELPYPNASDLQTSSTWQYALSQGSAGTGSAAEVSDPSWQNIAGADAPFGFRTVNEYIHRAEFELFDIKNDPLETRNLADDPEYAGILETYITRLKDFQTDTEDPWYIHWVYQDDNAHFFEEP
ncbi:MAG: sulfatase [Balneolales bacterium]